MVGVYIQTYGEVSSELLTSLTLGAIYAELHLYVSKIAPIIYYKASFTFSAHCVSPLSVGVLAMVVVVSV